MLYLHSRLIALIIADCGRMMYLCFNAPTIPFQCQLGMKSWGNSGKRDDSWYTEGVCISRGRRWQSTVSVKQLQPKGSNEVRTVSDPVVSCYIASAVILVLAIIEAVKEFQQGKIWGGVIYILLAIAGVLFSVFITMEQTE